MASSQRSDGALEDRTAIRWISSSGIETRTASEVLALIERQDGFLWIDIPFCGEEAVRLLSDVLGFHAQAIQDCLERQYIPKIHTYRDYVFLILHGIALDELEGRGHLLELDQFVGDRYLVTLHGQTSIHVRPEAVLGATGSVLQRIEAARLLPETPDELSHAILSTMIVRMEGLVSEIAQKVAAEERSIVRSEKRDPEELIDHLFRLRHQLLTIRTTASLSREAFAGRRTVARSSAPPASPKRLAMIEDLIDQYERLKSLCDGEKDFLDQVLAFTTLAPSRR